MPTNIVNVGPKPTLLYGTQGSGQSAFTILNTDSANTVYVSDTSNPMVGGSNTLPLLPGASVAFGSTAAVYALSAGPVIAVALLPAGTQYFVPASLINIGGAKVYVQAGKPTGVIPPNSIWFNTTLNALETYQGVNWVIQQLSGQELILPATLLGSQLANGTLTSAQLAAAAGILGSQIANATITGPNIAANTITANNIAANTITAAELAAGIVYAGIVNGTTITGGQLIGEGTGPQILAYSNATPALNNLVAAISSVATSDAYGNTIRDGISSIGPNGGVAYIAANQTSGQPFLILIPPSQTHIGGLPGVVANTFNAGAANEYYEMALSSGYGATNNPSSIGMYSGNSNGTSNSSIYFFINGTSVLVIESNTINVYQPITAINTSGNSGWLNVGADGSWTVNQEIQLQLMPDNMVAVRGEVTSTANISAGAELGSFTGQYVPAQAVRATACANSGTSTVIAVLVTISTSGEIQTYPGIPSGYTLNLNFQYPLN